MKAESTFGPIAKIEFQRGFDGAKSQLVPRHFLLGK
jgi:hypothetical protein